MDNEIRDRVPPGSVWRHLKTKGIYAVIGRCRIEATNSEAVLYQKASDLHPWARPVSEFLDGRFQRMS